MSNPRDFNADWASMKAEYADLEAAQERAAYEAKMARDDALAAAPAPARAWKPTRWELDRLREGKAFRDANPSTTPEGRSEDAALDAWLEQAEAAYAAAGARPEQPAAPLGDTHLVPLRDRHPAPGRGPDRNAPTEGQLRYLAVLADQLGYELQQPRDKGHASLIIDGAKKALAQQEADLAANAEDTPRPARGGRPATEGQINYLRSLYEERIAPTRRPGDGLDEPRWEDFTAASASATIDAWQRLPRPAAPAPTHGIREGHYAYRPDPEQPAAFYRVTEQGRIRVIAGPAEHPYRGELNDALLWIKANPREAAALYGQLIGRCGRCHRRLSDDDSIKRGLGPDCAQKTSW